ncbi:MULTISPECIES: tyrosine-protein phosphatase [Corynebacterium]|uniref:tyrosine-protein phosphatase n=1 Tax=Corynebacterium TaxID=1716 RepID=UPI0008A4C774|nr:MULTISPECIES: tyrosine-protein phosphatase [Corynebacterium]MDK8726092.1 tyrosine-protein phosphatase [Corynebacterium amycolatum]
MNPTNLSRANHRAKVSALTAALLLPLGTIAPSPALASPNTALFNAVTPGISATETQDAGQTTTATAPTGSPTPIESGSLSSLSNFRDVAGSSANLITTEDGRRIRQGLAYRSNALREPSDEDLARMTQAGVTRVVDLRNIKERSEGPDVLPDGVTYQVADIIDVRNGLGFVKSPVATTGEQLYGHAPEFYEAAGDSIKARDAEIFDDEVKYFGQLLGYELMITGEAPRTAWKDLLQALAYEDGAVVFHCSAGKDRTGLGAAFLLAILGVSYEAIEQDFLASNAYLNREDAVDKKWLKMSWDAIEENYGTFDNFVRQGIGLSDADINQLRQKYLV